MYTMTHQQNAESIKMSKNVNTKHPGRWLTRQSGDDNTSDYFISLKSIYDSLFYFIPDHSQVFLSFYQFPNFNGRD